MRRLIVALVPALLLAQSQPSLSEILERLQRLETENASLKQEVEQLRTEVSTLQGKTIVPIQEKVEIQEKRIEEQAQSKVEASQKFPIKLSGMVLMNAFHNGPQAAGNDTPTTAARVPGRQTGGVTFRQSVVGLEFLNPQTFLGAGVRAFAFIDFYEGAAETTNFYAVRLRTAGVEMNWKSRSLSFVQDKPLFSPRDPTALSFSGVSPLTGAGNLWRWQPQVRFEQRAALGEKSSAKLQFALIQTSEEANFDFATRGIPFERRRPGLEGRFELSHRFGTDGRIEIAPGFHVSESNINGRRYGSNLFSTDWLIIPMSKIEFSGLFWTGENIHHFGALRQGIAVQPNGQINAVQSAGGWSQVAFPFTSRLSLNLYGGIHDDRNADLLRTGIAANRTGAANLMYRIAPNIIVSLELMQNRTTYRDIGNRKNNRYDISVAYLFYVRV